MVSGTDEHGTPLLVQADKEGVTVDELADRYNRQIVDDLAGLGLSYDSLLPAPRLGTIIPWSRSCSGALRQRRYDQRDPIGAISPSTGRTSANLLYRRNLSHLRRSACRGDQCDTCGNQLLSH